MSDFKILDFNFSFQNATTITITNEDPKFPATEIKKVHRSRVARTTSVTAPQRIIIDLKTIEAVTMVVLAFDPTTGSNWSQSATVKVQANATPVFTSPSVDVTLDLDQLTKSDYLTHFFSSDQSFRFWSIEVNDATNGDGFIEFSKVLLGKPTELAQNPERGFTLALADKSNITETVFGHRYTDIFPQRKSLKFDYKVLSYADVKTLEDIYRDIGVDIPIAVVLDSTETIFEVERVTIYGYLQQTLELQHVNVALFDSGLTLLEAF